GNVKFGSNIGLKVFIPRLSLTPSNARILFKFQPRQFHLATSFARTINKIQEQSLKHVGLFLPQFFSWTIICYYIKSYIKKGLNILVKDGEDQDTRSYYF
ncbi:hypothetical protein AAZX31_19G041500, partial [Glycine max]